MSFKPLRLLKNEERRLLSGHLWIYSNEIDTKLTPLKNFEPGEQVIIENYQGKKLGIGYVNPRALICARLLSRDSNQLFNEELLIQRITQALDIREKIFNAPYYRLVFGESDGLPGLVIDRFGDVLVAQITTAGFENNKTALANALQKIFPSSSVLLRNDSPMRALENLSEEIMPLYGEPPQEIILQENGGQFIAPLWQGQKTGWFYDHRSNRELLQKFAKNKRILDVFSYLGAWGIQAAIAGASEVICIDSSKFATDYLLKNAELNQVQNRLSVINEDAFKALHQLIQAQEKFDVVIIDPPAFIKSRKHFKEGFQGYWRLNDLALKLVTKDGLLASASCSMHLSQENLLDILRGCAVSLQRNMRIIAQGHQGFDHPIHPAMPETNYLKAFFSIVN